MTTYLYVKTHTITGLKYLGQTKKPDPHKYRGSGKRWLNHLGVHGNHYTTEILKECEHTAMVQFWGQYYSDLWNIVESDEWANLKPETGDGSKGLKWNENQRRAQANKVIWNKGLTKETDHRVKKYGESSSETFRLIPRKSHNKGKTGGTNSQKGISKPYILGDNNPARRPEVQEKIRQALKGKPKSPEHLAKIKETKARKKAGIAPAL